MKILCVEKNDKYSKSKELLNCINYKGNKIFINSDLSKIKFKRKVKIIKKIKRILLKENVDKIIVSEDIKKDAEFINLLYSNSINITNDRWLFKMLSCKVIDKIISTKKKAESEIWITINDIDNITQNIIYKLSREFKRLNVITNHIRKFKKIEERLYEEGIMITITNNRKKSLARANLILNIDFPKELINQFTIFDDATIINLEGGIFIKKKRFCGRIINDIEIKSYKNKVIQQFIEENNLQKYNIKDICNVLNIVPECDIILI